MDTFKNIIGNWIQIVDDKNEITIEDYGYDTGVIEGTTDNHCVKCVAVNKCYFKNEKDKKPEKFDTTNIKIVDLLLNGLMPGLYHPNCHCKEIPIDFFGLDDIQVIIPEGKIEWLIRDKISLIISWGYEVEDINLLLDNVISDVKYSYWTGNYSIREITKSGVNATFYLTINGIKQKLGHKYTRVSSFMIFPNGKLKNNTIIGGKW